MRILIAQLNFAVGAIAHNTRQIIDVIQTHQDHYDIIVFSELSITGYPPEDWLLHTEFLNQVNQALKEIQLVVRETHVIVGHPLIEKKKRFNVVSVLHHSKIIKQYYKYHLPNYGIFDEKRYFATEAVFQPCVFSVKNKRVGLLICEDIWGAGPWENTVKAGAELIIIANASPFERHKLMQREATVRQHQQAEETVPVVYVNAVGGQDELLFDGQSFVMNEKGEVIARAKAFEPDLLSWDVKENFGGKILPCPPFSKEGKSSDQLQLFFPDETALIYNALVCATRDYVVKNGFKGVLLGLSGGIDSALTLAIAADAIGAKNVEAVMLPSRYTSLMSIEDAQSEIDALQVVSRTISIEPVFKNFLSLLTPEMTKHPLTQQNLQARCRGILLMALSNETGKLVLTTSNKSELAVGYATLYGDLCGAFSVLKDVLKTWVYQLAHYRNSISKTPIIPQRVIERPPSAELAFNQTDQDTLPDYTLLDTIITRYVEQHQTAEEIIKSGIAADTLYTIIQKIHLSEYKRRQSPIGPKITSCAFGRDWRYPINNSGNENVHRS